MTALMQPFLIMILFKKKKNCISLSVTITILGPCDVIGSDRPNATSINDDIIVNKIYTLLTVNISCVPWYSH